MAKNEATSKCEQEAIALLQEIRKKRWGQFPRPAETWAADEPVRPLRGLLMSKEKYASLLKQYEADLKKAKAFNPEKYYVRGYLAGTILEDERGRHRQEYFTEGIGRLLLAELLRSEAQIPRDIRELLATLISPQRSVVQHSEREFVIQFRRKGKRPNYIREIQISEDIAKALDSGQVVKQAIGQVMDKYDISRSEAMRIWEKKRDVFIQLGWLKNARRTKSKIKHK